MYEMKIDSLRLALQNIRFTVIPRPIDACGSRVKYKLGIGSK